MLFPMMLLASTATLPLLQVEAADKYLKTLEDRIASLEAEVNTTRADSKGKGSVSSAAIPVYVTPKSKYVQEIKLRGRLQWQAGYAWGHGYAAGSHTSYATQEIRSARIGAEGTLTNDFKFKIDFECVNSVDAKVGLAEGYVEYTGIEFFQPKVGKYRPQFGYDEMIPLPKSFTVEKTRLSYGVGTGEITGASINGQYGVFNYSLGIFNAVNGTAQAAFDVEPLGNGNQDFLYNASAGVKLKEVVGFPLDFQVDYMNFTTNPTVCQPNRLNLQQNIDLGMHTAYGPFDLFVEWYNGFNSNASAANLNKTGSNSEYAWSLAVCPSVFVIPEKLQAVFRYEMGDAGFTTTGINQPFGSRVRYERYLRSGGATAESVGALHYYSLYGGLNYYINGDDLKLMFGYQFSEQSGSPTGGNANNRSASTLYGAVRMMF